MLAGLRSPENLEQTQPGADLRPPCGPIRRRASTGSGSCPAWGWALPGRRHGPGQDDPGAGPAAALKREHGDKPSLLVLPASLLANWKSEMARFAPTLRGRVRASVGNAEGFARADGRRSREALQDTDVVLTTYGMLLRQPWLLDVGWRLVVLDEAQAIKNPAARQTKAVKRLKADARIVLTGTPVENRLADLWSLFDFLCPGLLGSQEKFKKFVKTLETARAEPLCPAASPGAAVHPAAAEDRQAGHRRPARQDRSPGLLRPEQAAGGPLRQAGPGTGRVARRAVDGMKRRGLVLAYLMRFKQLCNHPSQLLGDGRFEPEESGKFARLAEICEEIASRQEKTLVFTQFREMAEPLAELPGADLRPRRAWCCTAARPWAGGSSSSTSSNATTARRIFVLSLKAGGTGLNLTAASHVIHFDRWWNPAVENQATDRAFRIGQRRNVLVHKFVCRGTVEEKIDALIEEKTQLAADLLEGGAEKMLTEMTDAQLIQFVSLDIDKACE